MSNEPNKIIYSMIKVSKFHDKKPILSNISLSYFYGAKIGVLGMNGSGKSTLLKILAGVDKDFQGETVLAPGYTIGYLEQEPQLDETRTVREIVEEYVTDQARAAWEEEARTRMIAQSPLTFAGRVRTPTLFIHGEVDQRVPITEAEQMYFALKRRGVPAKLIQYAGMPHGITGHWNQVHRMINELDWFNTYLK